MLRKNLGNIRGQHAPADNPCPCFAVLQRSKDPFEVPQPPLQP